MPPHPSQTLTERSAYRHVQGFARQASQLGGKLTGLIAFVAQLHTRSFFLGELRTRRSEDCFDTVRPFDKLRGHMFANTHVLASLKPGLHTPSTVQSTTQDWARSENNAQRSMLRGSSMRPLVRPTKIRSRAGSAQAMMLLAPACPYVPGEATVPK